LLEALVSEIYYVRKYVDTYIMSDREFILTWWDCVKDDTESLGLTQKDAQSRNKWRRRIKGATG